MRRSRGSGSKVLMSSENGEAQLVLCIAAPWVTCSCGIFGNLTPAPRGPLPDFMACLKYSFSA